MANPVHDFDSPDEERANAEEQKPDLGKSCSGLVKDQYNTWHCPHCCEGWVDDDGVFHDHNDDDEEGGEA